MRLRTLAVIGLLGFAAALSGCTGASTADGEPRISPEDAGTDGPGADPARPAPRDGDPSDSPPGVDSTPALAGATQFEELAWAVAANGDSTWVLGQDLCNVAALAPGPVDGIWSDRFPIDPDTIGNQYRTSGAMYPLSLGYRFGFLDADGALLDTRGGPRVVPDGAAYGVAWACASGPYYVAYASAPVLEGQLTVKAWAGGEATCDPDAWWPARIDGVDHVAFAINQTVVGSHYRVDIPYPPVPAFTPPVFRFLTDRGVVLPGGEAWFDGDAVHEQGQVPEGAAVGVFYSCHDADMHGTFRAGPLVEPYFSRP